MTCRAAEGLFRKLIYPRTDAEIFDLVEMTLYAMASALHIVLIS